MEENAHVVTLSPKGQVVVPQEMRAALGLRAGDKVVVLLRGDAVIVTTPAAYARHTRGLLAGTWGDADAIASFIAGERASWA